MRNMEHPLKSYRLRRDWSQERLAEELGSTKGTVSRWEAGSHLPRYAAREIIRKKTGITAADLLEAAASR